MPSCPATWSTTDCLSPLIKITLIPASCSAVIAFGVSTFKSSARAKAPKASSLILTATVLAICHTFGISLGSVKLANSAVPTFTTPKPSILACIPAPLMTLISVTFINGKFRSVAALTNAVASGWLACASTLAAICNTSSTAIDLSTITWSTIVGLPMVKVPVLSSTTVSMLPAASRLCASLNQTPWRAATPIPAMIAAGVAKPKAQGHAMTNTETACIKAVSIIPVSHHVTPKVISAMTTTTGTNTAVTLSARRAKLAFEPWASLRACTISPSFVSLPLALTRYNKLPFSTNAPANNLSPTSFLSGTDSPVKWLSTHQPAPSITTPSVATRLPCLARKISPTCTSLRATLWKSPLGCCCSTSSGVKDNNKSILLRLCFLVRSSRYLPVRTKAMTMTPASKYTAGLPSAPWPPAWPLCSKLFKVPSPWVSHRYVEYAQIVTVPMTTSTSILARPPLIDAQALL